MVYRPVRAPSLVKIEVKGQADQTKDGENNLRLEIVKVVVEEQFEHTVYDRYLKYLLQREVMRA